MNGKTGTLIYLEQGIRQGDPISSYIFIICIEYFGHYICSTFSQPK